MLRGLGALALFVAAPAAAQNINTISTYTGAVGWFGQPGPIFAQALGQTFTVTTDPTLERFSLYLDGPVVDEFDDPTGPIEFVTYIYAWNGSAAVGPALYTSDVRQFAGSTPGSPQEFSFETPGLTLDLGGQYVAFYSTLGHRSGPDIRHARVPWGGVVSDTYSGGSAVVAYPRSSATDFSSATWNDVLDNHADIWFRGIFDSASTVPEPATWAMMVAGFGLAGGAMRRRKTKVQTKLV